MNGAEEQEQAALVQALKLEYDAAVVRARDALIAARRVRAVALNLKQSLTAAEDRLRWLRLGPEPVWAKDPPTTECRVTGAEGGLIRLVPAPPGSGWGDRAFSARTGYSVVGPRNRLDVPATLAALEAWRASRDPVTGEALAREINLVAEYAGIAGSVEFFVEEDDGTCCVVRVPSLGLAYKVRAQQCMANIRQLPDKTNLARVLQALAAARVAGGPGSVS